jgi:hypothetical protein
VTGQRAEVHGGIVQNLGLRRLRPDVAPLIR